MAWRSEEHRIQHFLWLRHRGDRRVPGTPQTCRRIDPALYRRSGEAHPTTSRNYGRCPTRSCRHVPRAAPLPVALRFEPGAPGFRAGPSRRTLRPSNRSLVRARPGVVRGVLHTTDLPTCTETIASRLIAPRGDVRLQRLLGPSCRENRKATSQLRAVG